MPAIAAAYSFSRLSHSLQMDIEQLASSETLDALLVFPASSRENRLLFQKLHRGVRDPLLNPTLPHDGLGCQPAIFILGILEPKTPGCVFRKFCRQVLHIRISTHEGNCGSFASIQIFDGGNTLVGTYFTQCMPTANSRACAMFWLCAVHLLHSLRFLNKCSRSSPA
jgi:hypothetical protein